MTDDSPSLRDLLPVGWALARPTLTVLDPNYEPPDYIASAGPRFYAKLVGLVWISARELAPTCWTWAVDLRNRRWPKISCSGGRAFELRRFAYLLQVGELAPDFVARPNCGTPLCLRGSHLTARRKLNAPGGRR